MNDQKKPLIIHPFMFAVYPILFLFAYNRDELVTFPETLLPLLIVLSFALISFVLFWRVLRDRQKAGIVVSIFLLLFFSYGHVYDALKNWRIGGFSPGQHQYLLLIWSAAIIAGSVAAIRTSRRLDNLTGFLNVVAVTLVAISLLNTGLYQLRTGRTSASTKNTDERAAITRSGKEQKTRPDIYYIILDGYANPQTLKEIYGFDDTYFTKHLTEKGFRVIAHSRSNYALTYLSLSSSLNMEYINYLTDELGPETKDRAITRKLVRDNKVMAFLKSRGYRTVHFSSGWSETLNNGSADLNIKCGQGNEFLELVVQTSMISCIEQSILGNDARHRVLDTFAKLGEVPKIKGPKFVFAHILTPHPPYLFDSKGQPVSGTELKMCGKVWLEKEHYLDQLEYANQKVETLVDQILKKSQTPPVIILQSDHGSASLLSRNNSSCWNSPTDQMLKERMRNFSAFYMPDNGESVLYDSITPANDFRLIFNYYFDTHYELLDDRSYFSTYQKPFDFVNVTDKAQFSSEH
jgi:hypothetical protein